MKEGDNHALILENRDFFLIAQEYLDQGKNVEFLLKGNSMRPFLRPGDKVRLTRDRERSLRVGEILLVRWKEKFILHRLVFASSRYLFLAGDNNLFQIERVDRSCMVARVTGARRSERSVGHLGFTGRLLGMLWFGLRPLRWIEYLIKKKQ